jgi:hypothetical protein
MAFTHPNVGFPLRSSVYSASLPTQAMLPKLRGVSSLGRTRGSLPKLLANRCHGFANLSTNQQTHRSSCLMFPIARKPSARPDLKARMSTPRRSDSVCDCAGTTTRNIVETGVANGASSAHMLLGFHKNRLGTLHSIEVGDSTYLSLRREPGWIVPDWLRRALKIPPGGCEKNSPPGYRAS